MNDKTLNGLEYPKIKQLVAEYAKSYLGRQHVENMQPMTHMKSIRIALDETEEAFVILNSGGNVPIPTLTGIDTVIQLLGTGYMFGEQDFSNIHLFLHSCGQLKTYMAAKTAVAPTISRYAASIYELASLKSEIERCLRNGRVTDAASKELSKTRKKLAVIEDRLKNKVSALLTKHRDILQESLVSMRGDRYVLPVKKEHRRLLPGSVLDESSSGQTVYIEPSEIAHLQYELMALRAEEAREEAKVLGYLTSVTEEAEKELRINIEAVGIYDFLFAKARYALSIGGSNIELNEQGVIDIHDATHPLLGTGTVPLDFSIGGSYQSLIITGPNTGGKTVALKTVGLLSLMVQSGLLVPAKTGSKFAIFTKIAADIGDGQSIEQSLSTFSAHIKNLVDILRDADQRTLVLIDEMASGTDPGEGVGLSIAILEELQRRGTTVVATTHFNEIKHFAAVTPGFENARMEFDARTLRPLYRLHIGDAGHSYAFVIARNLGMSEHIIRRSQEITTQRGEQNPIAAAKSERSQISAETDRSAQPSDSALNEEMEAPAAEDRPRAKRFEIGDSVMIAHLKRTGIVFKEEDARGMVGVFVNKQKCWINQKRLSLHIAKAELYPDDYDFDIILETKENRKKKKLMSRKHVEGLMIVKKPDEL
ncbi:MAG: mismatch repair protein MutS [Paenibacillus sp.]|nr:mismatch repair protein MutS [Paenibacillus sp.]